MHQVFSCLIKIVRSKQRHGWGCCSAKYWVTAWQVFPEHQYICPACTLIAKSKQSKTTLGSHPSQNFRYPVATQCYIPLHMPYRLWCFSCLTNTIPLTSPWYYNIKPIKSTKCWSNEYTVPNCRCLNSIKTTVQGIFCYVCQPIVPLFAEIKVCE